MDDSDHEVLFGGVVTPETAIGIAMYYVTASWVPYHIHTMRCDHSPCAELGFSTHLPTLGCSPAGVALGPEASPKRAKASEGVCGVDRTRALN